MFSASRKRRVVRARQAACWALKTAFPNLPFVRIGHLLGLSQTRARLRPVSHAAAV
jgi:chromosomal replication initiation ATPase DnaA